MTGSHPCLFHQTNYVPLASCSDMQNTLCIGLMIRALFWPHFHHPIVLRVHGNAFSPNFVRRSLIAGDLGIIDNPFSSLSNWPQVHLRLERESISHANPNPILEPAEVAFIIICISI